MKTTRTLPRLAVATAAVLAIYAPRAMPQWTMSAGIETSTGKYGKAVATDETRLPLRATWRSGPWRVRAELPLVMRVDGAASALAREEEEDDEVVSAPPLPSAGRRSQSGVGDLTLGAWYRLRDARAMQPAVEVGARLKTAVASGDRCLLTNGATDVSIEARAMYELGRVQPFSTLGWTRRGDPKRRDDNCVATGGTVKLRNPLYASLGAAVPLDERWALDAEYEYRQRLRPTASARRELVFGVDYRVSRSASIRGYGSVGLSDASPDRGAGLRLSWRF